jgi:hypothetical protein
MMVVIKQSLLSSQKNLELVGLCKCENIWQTQHLKPFLVMVYGSCEKIYIITKTTHETSHMKRQCYYNANMMNNNMEACKKNLVLRFNTMLLKYNV